MTFSETERVLRNEMRAGLVLISLNCLRMSARFRWDAGWPGDVCDVLALLGVLLYFRAMSRLRRRTSAD